MFNKKWRRRLICLTVLPLIGLVPLAAVEVDVVYVNDGNIILGKLIGPADAGVSYLSFGEEITIPLENITTTEKDLTALSKKTVQVVLRDGSRIEGKIVDYDETLGIFIDISFGTLSIPVRAIWLIYEKEIKNRYTGPAYQVSVYGGIHAPMAVSSADFGMSWTAGAGLAWAIPRVRGLYAGARATVYGMDYLKDAVTEYVMFSVLPEVTYKYLGLRMKEGFPSRIVPYVSLGAGPVYIAIDDPASYPSSYGNITASAVLYAGLELSVIRNIALKIEGNGSAILQNGAAFMTSGVQLSVCLDQ